MSRTIESPSSIMYDCMKQFGGIKKVNLATVLFSDTYRYGGAPIGERLSERTFLSRVVVNSEPGDFPERAFSDFHSSALSVCSMMYTRYQGLAGRQQVVSYFAGEACDAMCASLKEYGLNDVLYFNMASRVSRMELSSDTDKATLLVLLFLATGCLGDPGRAAEITQDFSRQVIDSSFRTSIAQAGTTPLPPQDAPDVRLGLCRVSNGKMRLPAYELSIEPDGTEIGSLTTASGAINDVGDNVSRRHVRVYRADDGQWYALGLGSTNGTTLISGDTKTESVIEPPAKERKQGFTPQACPILPGDMLCLADDTKFMVLELA